MAEYICREAIIDDLEKEIEAGNVALDEDVWINKGLRIAIRDIKDSKSANVQPNQWISVNDKMPEDGQPVLYVYNINPDLKVVMYGWHETIKGLGSGWHQAGVGGARSEEDVSHWQPLPEPPKEG